MPKWRDDAIAALDSLIDNLERENDLTLAQAYAYARVVAILNRATA